MRVIERKQRVHGTPEKAKRDREEAIQVKRRRMESFADACREFEGVPKAVEDMRDFHRDVQTYVDDDSESTGNVSSDFEITDEFDLLSGCRKRKRLRKAVDSEEEDEEEDNSEVGE